MTPAIYLLLQIQKELLTRKEPYSNICFEPVVMFAIINGQVPSLEDSQLYSGDMQVQKRLYELCKQCWVSDPKKRATIEAILEYMSPTDFRYAFFLSFFICYDYSNLKY